MAAAAAAVIESSAEKVSVLLDRCSSSEQVKQVHAHIFKTGLALKPTQSNKLLKLYATSCCREAQMVFDRIDKPDVLMYNTMIRAYSSSDRPRNAVALYQQMVLDSVSCNAYTFPFLFKACSGFGCVELVRQVHTHVLRTGFGSEVHTMNALVHAYAVLGDIESASATFSGLVAKDVVSWNTMMNAVVKCGKMEQAFEIFRTMPEKSVVSWTTMIKACLEFGLANEALELFQDMMASGVRPDIVAISCAVAACGDTGSLTQGEWIHSYIGRNRIEIDSTLCCVLIDMYAKCGALDKSQDVFSSSSKKSVATWTAMINGFGAHGQATEALKWFYKMQEAGLKPNSITSTSILTACSHAGLVEEGKTIFETLEHIHNLEPTIEHYGCIVDLLSRAGQLEEALDFIQNMPIKANAAIWSALASACYTYKDINLGKKIAKKLVELEPDEAGRYVQLASLYALVEDWDQVSLIRQEMKDNGASKNPGCSLIQLNGNVHEISVAL